MPIPMSAPDLDASDEQAVLEVLRSGRLALGPKITEFEQAMADYVGVPFAVAVSSGTAALHLIVKSLGLGAGDEVLVPSFTFAASVNALLYEGVTPVFVDCLEESGNLDPSDLEKKITARTKAIMAVDIFGRPADWDALESISQKNGLPIIDDCCEALGAEHKGRRLGSLGVAGAFAFYPNKQITTGEGGIIVTHDRDLAELCRSLANQGRGAMGSWLEHERLGYNYRMDELSAALGVSQLRRLESFLSKRERVASLYHARLSALPGMRIPSVDSRVRSSWFVYVVTLDEGLDRTPVMAAMEARGIPVRGYFSPVHTQPYIRSLMGDLQGSLPITESLARRTIALPFHNNLTVQEVEEVAEALEAALAQPLRPSPSGDGR